MVSAFKVKQIFMFILLYISYTSCYLLRKPFGIIKLSIKESMNLAEHSLGYIDLAFSLPYAVFSLCFSSVGDYISPKYILGGGLIGSSVAASVIGSTDQFTVLLSLIFVIGAFQAVTWPGACSILSSWVSDKRLTSIMGLFGTNLLLGSVASAGLTIKTIELYNWQHAFYIPSLICITIGLLDLAFGNRYKKQIEDMTDMEARIEGREANESAVLEFEQKKESKLKQFLGLFRTSIIPHVSLSLFCVKAIRNAMLFWLPYYLSSVFKYSESYAGFISLIFEVGGFLSVLLTLIVDKCIKNDLLAITFFNTLCSLLCVVLYFANDTTMGSYLLYFSLFTSGAVSSTSEIILCGSMAMKLGNEHGSKSTIVGIVNGIGSLGNVVEGPIMGVLIYFLGIRSLIPFIIISIAIGGVFSLRAYYVRVNEMKSINQQEFS